MACATTQIRRQWGNPFANRGFSP